VGRAREEPVIVQEDHLGVNVSGGDTKFLGQLGKSPAHFIVRIGSTPQRLE